MDDPRPKMSDAVKEAMKSKNNERRDVIRNVLSAIKQVEIDTQKDVDAAAAVEVLQKEAKKRRETIEESVNAGREDLADEARRELVIIEEFLPPQLSAEEIKVIVLEVVAEVGATSAKDMNKVMGPLMARVKGLADGKLVNQIVREVLT